MEWTTKIRETVREQLISNCGEILGVRIAGDDYNVGDELPCSYDWTAMEYAEEIEAATGKAPETELPGTCAVQIMTNSYCADDESRISEVANEAIDTISRAYSAYDGCHVYLITGNGYEYGEDADEVIVYNATVAAKIM